MNDKFYFLFGYHGPDVWDEVNRDPNFDCESSGIFKIQAENEHAAKEWGEQLAKWYVNKLFDSEENKYWSANNYACWIEKELPSGFENVASIIQFVLVNEFPDFETVRDAFDD